MSLWIYAVENEDEDVAETFVGELIATGKQLRKGETMGAERNSANEEELQLLQKLYVEMQANIQQSTGMFEEEISLLKTSSTDSQFQFSKAPEVVIQCEFQINGQIGELGQKDKQFYTNLMHQI